MPAIFDKLLRAGEGKIVKHLHRIAAQVNAVEDDIASLKNAELVRDTVSGPTEMLLLKDSYHMITIDRERRMLARRSAQFFAAVGASEPVELESAA